jgi:WD40 repeat protein
MSRANVEGEPDPPYTCPMKPVRRGLLLAVGALALLVFPASGWGAFPGANGRIAYIKGYDIYTVRPDGSGTERLTNDQTYNDQPSWSASGHRLVYLHGSHYRTQQVFTIGAHGGNPTQLTHEKGVLRYPHFSPSGRRIVYAKLLPDESRIVTIRSDGSDRRRVVSGDYFDSPSYSPNGKRIAFRGEFRGKQDGIWTIKPDGSGLHRLTRTGAYSLHLFPEWAPDGRHILFARCDLEVDDIDCYGDLKLMRLDGSHKRTVSGFSGYTPPILSPAGDRIARVRSDGVWDDYYCSDIYTTTLDGTNQGPVTDYCEQFYDNGTREFAGQPSWQPIPAR